MSARPNSHRIFLPAINAAHELSWLIGTSAGQELLGQSHRTQKRRRLRCMCQSEPGRRPELVVRLLQDHYYVARMPDTGHQHDRVHCPMFSENGAHSGSAEYEGALRYRGETLEVKVAFPLHASTAQSAAATRVRLAHGATRRGAMGLAGLLSLLWTQAGLNSWVPGTVLPWLRVHSRLVAAAQAIYLGKRRLADHLFVQGEPRAPWLPSVPSVNFRH